MKLTTIFIVDNPPMIIKKYFDLSYWTFWIGGIVGTILPDTDRALYPYLGLPEPVIQKKDLIFHTTFFQIIFLVLTFWMITSSGSFFGRGLVLAFSLHLLVDQAIYLIETKDKVRWLVMFLLLLTFGFLL